MSKKIIKISAASVGSDESGTGGLFGGCAFAVFKVTKSTFRKLQTFDWFKEVLDIMDSKGFSEERCQELCEIITKEFKAGKDFLVWTCEANDYNQKAKSLQDHEKIKFVEHDKIHKTIEEDASFHVADYFFKDSSAEYYDFFKERNLETMIDMFFKKGEFKLVSISIASIIARGTHLKKFYAFTKGLGIDITDEESHNLPPTKIEPILKKLEDQGMTREYIFENYCKLNIVEKYNQKLLSVHKQHGLLSKSPIAN